jgi:hypothetical protein
LTVIYFTPAAFFLAKLLRHIKREIALAEIQFDDWAAAFADECCAWILGRPGATICRGTMTEQAATLLLPNYAARDEIRRDEMPPSLWFEPTIRELAGPAKTEQNGGYLIRDLAAG